MAPIKANLKLFLCLLVSWIFSEARAQVSPTHAGSKPHDPSSPSYRLPSKPAPPFLQRCNPLVSRSLTVLCETTNDSLHSTQQTKQLNPIHDDTIALCGYPHVKVSIRDLSQISTAAPIFQQYGGKYHFHFLFFSFASNFPCKIL